MFLEKWVNSVSERIANDTGSLWDSVFGKVLKWSILIGPTTFLPTLSAALFLKDIEALQTPTWGMMTIVNIGAFLSLARTGDWIMRLVGMLWVAFMLLMTVVVFVRSV